MALSQGTMQVGGQGYERPKIERPIVPEKSYTFDYLGITEGTQNAYEDRFKDRKDPTAKKVPVFIARYALVLRGADALQTKVEALPAGPERDALFAEFKAKYLDKGHGLYLSRTMNQVPLRIPKNGKPSNLLVWTQQMLNGNKAFTEADLPTISERLNALENRKTEIVDGQPTLVPIVPDEQFQRPQFYGFVIVGENGKNYLNRISGLVDEDDRLPNYRPLARAIDAREADDDPNINCDVCGEHIHGFVSKFGETAGQWISNIDAAEDSRERYDGQVLCPTHKRLAREAKQAVAPKSGEEGMPF